MVGDVYEELRKEDEVMLEEEVKVEGDGIVKCKGGNDGRCQDIGQGSTIVLVWQILICPRFNIL